MTHLGIQSNCCCTQEAESCCNIANEQNWSYKYFFSTVGKTYRYEYGCDCISAVQEDPNSFCPEGCYGIKYGCSYETGLCSDDCASYSEYESNILICNGYSIELYASGGIVHYPNAEIAGCPPIPKNEDFPCTCDLCPIDWELNEPKFSFLQNRQIQYISPEYVNDFCPNHPKDNFPSPSCNLPKEDRATAICLGNIYNNNLTCLCSTTPPEFRTKLYGTYTKYSYEINCNLDGTCGTWSQKEEIINFNILAFARLRCESPFICGETPTTILHTLKIYPYTYGNFTDGFFYVDAETLELIPIFNENIELGFFANLTPNIDPESANWVYYSGPAVPFECPTPPSPFPDCSNCYSPSCEGRQTGDSCFSIKDMPGWNGTECLGKNPDGSPYSCCCRDRGDECLSCGDIGNEIPTLLISSLLLD